VAWCFAGSEYSNNGLDTLSPATTIPGGQWWQQDSYPGQISDPNSTNRYAYAGDNPITNTDLAGQSTETDAIILTFGVIGTVTAFIGLVTLAPEATLLVGLSAAIGFDASVASLAVGVGCLFTEEC
jgi:hypothetical protein